MITPTLEQVRNAGIRPTPDQREALRGLQLVFDDVRYQARMPLGVHTFEARCYDHRGRPRAVYRLLRDGTTIKERSWE